MAIFAGLYARAAAPAELEAAWAALTSGLGPAAAEAAEGPLRAAVFPQHEGEHRGRTAGFPIGLGDPACPPWLRCRYDPATRTATIETDRHGFAILYVREVGPIVAFATSAVALARIGAELERDPSAIAEMVAFGHLLGTRTLRAGVSAIPQGCDLVVDASGARPARRFRYGDLELAPGARARDAARALIPVWRQAVRTVLGLRADGREPVLVPLSGGLDSRLLAASAAEAGAPVEAFTFGRSDEAPDAAIARTVAAELGAAWRFLRLDDDWLAGHAARAAALTDGQLDLISSWGVSVLEGVPAGRLRLDGFAGDVVLGGSFLDPGLGPTPSREQKLEATWKARSYLGSEAWQALLRPDARDELGRRARLSLAGSLGEETCDGDDPRWSDFWVLEHRMRRFTMNGPLIWQARSRTVLTFFEPRWLDRLLAVPPAVRRGGGLQRAFLRGGWPRMADIPWQKTGRPLPRGGVVEALGAILRRRPAYPPGAPFFDFDAAFSTSPRLRSFVSGALLDPRTGVERFGCFDRPAVEQLLADVSAGRRRGMQRLSLLLTLVVAERLWSERPELDAPTSPG